MEREQKNMTFSAFVLYKGHFTNKGANVNSPIPGSLSGDGDAY